MNILTAPFLSTLHFDGRRVEVTLPGLLASAIRDEIDDLPAVRPHQRLPFHAFLAQLGALAMLQSGRLNLPDDESDWITLLRCLTTGFDDDEPWQLLLEKVSKPALLQPPIPEGRIEVLKAIETTPDGLDYLVTSKNHDIKSARIRHATPQLWFYALLTLQTMEGFLGVGNYGISRMNGGFASRAVVGLAPPGGVGARLKRDIRRLVELRLDRPKDDPHQVCRKTGGLLLLWIQPWDGAHQLPFSALDP